ncbi:F1 complex, delta/epsilon subunit of ATPase [Choanephora cucurbitarum]|uniref:ATP synthase subunit delta, mitochondrial n=1 Tax=Choanephora cucurbitarum TaxID=101091 RepID=A0A1C7N2K5_9FUNG|nr:F1 complex, delta/epsilon subunit of ATPase [Choanephora cucurbitarum]OBZ83218.1 ATP synthase subunit delta, mitochondrial [Choanephora cucurbitarum]
MNVLARSARAAIKPMARFYATEAAAASDALRLTLVVPHKAIYKATNVQQVNLAATSGDMGILANHVPSIEQLNPGVVEVIESGEITKKFFVSGGFATINPDSSLNINAVEAFPLEELSLERVQAGLAEAQRQAGSAASEQEKAAAKIEVEVYEALQHALTK